MLKIDNLNMPDHCAVCPFYIGMNNGRCLVLEAQYDGYTLTSPEYERYEYCPLIEDEEE